MQVQKCLFRIISPISLLIDASVFVLSQFKHVRLFATPWTVAHQAPLSEGFSRQEYCSGLPHPLPGNLPDSGVKPMPLTSPASADRFFTTRATSEALDVRISI